MKKLFPLIIPFLFLFTFLLSAQEVFVFDSIPSNVTAGDSFYIHIICTSTPGFNGAGQLSIRPDPGYNPMQPTGMILFNSGEWGGYVTVFMASDSLHINCTEYGHNDTNLSPRLIVSANVPQRLRLLLPGQGTRPGDLSSRGREYIFYVQTADVSFNVNIAVTDYWWNPVGIGQDTVRLTSNNPFPIFPPDTALIAGNLDLSVKLRTAMDACTIFVEEITTNDTILVPDTSSTIRIVPDLFSKLLLIAPSQTVLAGDTATNTSLLPGATPDTTDWQVAGSPFDITVYAVDDCWNPVGSSAPMDSIRIYGQIGPNTLADTNVLSGGNTTVTFISDINGFFRLQAEDLDNSSITTKYQTPIKIAGAHYRLVADEELDTIISGSPIHLHIYYEDEKDNVITNDDHPIIIYVYRGSGSLTPTDTIVRTLTTGTVEPVVYYTTMQVEELYLRVSAQETSRLSTPGENENPIYLRPNVTPDEPIVNYPNPFGSEQKSTTIVYYLSQDCDVYIAIYDRFGNLVKKWNRNGVTGYNYLSWSGTNNRGTRVANGAYLLTVRATDRTAIVVEYRRWIAVVK
ncbi:hypothetical protein KAX75_11245 [candidate division WOR-3 bacterium]|nr:hypothetical protein [candidate division WOR-3 bacterium]